VEVRLRAGGELGAYPEPPASDVDWSSSTAEGSPRDWVRLVTGFADWVRGHHGCTTQRRSAIGHLNFLDVDESGEKVDESGEKYASDRPRRRRIQ
jgi:hypothetical protein